MFIPKCYHAVYNIKKWIHILYVCVHMYMYVCMHACEVKLYVDFYNSNKTMDFRANECQYPTVISFNRISKFSEKLLCSHYHMFILIKMLVYINGYTYIHAVAEEKPQNLYMYVE